MRRKATCVVLGIVLGACGFSTEQFTGDGGVLTPVTVGFAQETSVQDESSGTIQVIVRLSRSAEEDIAVPYSFSGGTATAEDYEGTDGTLTFLAGETERGIELKISIDTIEEPDETIELTLSSPPNAELGTSRHTITINHALLPRVNFSLDMSEADESGSVTLNLTLDTAPLIESTVTIAPRMTGTAALGFDWAMPANPTVTFPINSLSQTISVPIMIDQVDEVDETLVVEIASSTNVVIGTMKERTHKILDNDMPPTVSITTASGPATEGNTGTMTGVAVVVTLSGPSGKMVTVPLTFGGGSATETADYTYSAKTDLVFTPNQDPALSEVSKSITINVIGDATDEENQTVITSLAAPTNATLATAGASHTLTITDDDNPPTVQFMSASSSAPEGDSGTSTVSYVCQLSLASEKMISFTIELGGSATIPSDYTTVPAPSAGTATISIAPGMTTGKLDLVIVGETTVEGQDEMITMTIAAPFTNVTAAAANQSRTHTIDDTDPN